MRKKGIHTEGKSLKTFLLYTALVVLVIGIALLIKAFFVVRQSKYDGSHHFTISFMQNNKVKEVLVCNPDTDSMVLLSSDGSMTSKALITKMFILPDASIELPSSVSLTQNPSSNLTQVLWHYPIVKTDLTLYDLFRLYYFTRSVPPANTVVQPISTLADSTPDTSLLTDNAISQENVTIQIINATDTTGLGANVAQILTLMGANIVDVSTALNTQQTSKIQYYGPETYTLQKIYRLLSFPVSKLSSQQIANIVITLGADSYQVLPF